MRGRKRALPVLCLSLLGLGFVAPPRAAAGGADAWRTLGAMRQAERGRAWRDARGLATLTIKLDGGGELSRRFRFYRKRRGGAKISTLTVFDYPPEASGTAILREHERGRCDRAWIHQPALRRIRRLAPSMAGGNLGGDLDPLELSLAWELWRWRPAQAKAVWEGTEQVAGEPCERILVEPARPVCGFGQVRGWISQQGWVVRRAQLFDPRAKLMKTIEFDRIEWIEGHPTAVLVTISRPGHAGTSQLAVDEVGYDVGLGSDLFHVGHLGSGVASR